MESDEISVGITSNNDGKLFKENKEKKIQIDPSIVDISSLIEQESLTEAEIVQQIFNNNAEWAKGFLKQRRAAGRKIYPDPDNKKNFIMTTSGDNNINTVIRAHPMDLRDQIDILLESAYIYGKVLSIV